MTTATPPSGSVDESIAFRQGVSVVTIKDQLTGMLPKFSAGTRSRIVVDGNAPDSDVYFDDSMMGLGPGSIVPVPAAIFPVFSYDHDFDKFVELFDIQDPGIMKLEVSGSYEGEFDATFRVQVADPDDDDVFTISHPIFMPVSGSSGLNDLNVVLENITETTSEGEENIIVASGSYDSSQGIAIYKVEIATASEGSADTIKWYKNDELITTSADGDVILSNDGNVLEDGDNRIVIRFDYDGFEDVYYGAEQKHTIGDSWTIVAGTQQIRWSQGDFDDSNGITLVPIEGTERNIGAPTGIIQTTYQPLADGVYIKLPAQTGYSDGTDPNVEAPIWEFKVRSLKPEAAITAMQEAAGKIQIYPDHRVEQRDFGQPKFHNDFDVMTQWQQQVATVEIVPLQSPDGPYIGEQYNLEPGKEPWTATSSVKPRTEKYNTQLYDSILENKKNYSWAQADTLDAKNGLDISQTPDPIERGWKPSTISDDGSVGPYFTIYDLHEKEMKDRKNHFWFNFGNTQTNDIKKYDDKDPRPALSSGLGIDVSARELSKLELSGNDVETQKALYEIYNVDAMSVIETPSTGESYWSNDNGITMVAATDVHPDGGAVVWPTSVNSSGSTLWSLIGSGSGSYTVPENVGWSPDIDEDEIPDVLPSRMSTDINGNILVDPITSVPTPLEVSGWMTWHGYELAAIDEITWLLREGYTPYEDALHNRWFTIYDFDFRCFCIKFNVTDVLGATPFNSSLPAAISPIPTDVDTGDLKARQTPDLVFVHINRYDKAKDVTLKIIERLNRNIPAALLNPAHPFYQGAKVDDDVTAVLDDNDNFIVQVNLQKPGKVQVSEDSGDLPTDFQCWLRTHGSLGYCQRVLDDDNITSHYVGNFIFLFNPTRYWYPAVILEDPFTHADLGFTIDASNQLWSNDEGLTVYEIGQVDDEGIVVSEWNDNYKPYVGVDANSPHLIWYNVAGITKIPTMPTSTATTKFYDLWSYSLPEGYAAHLETATTYGHTLEVKCYPQSIDRTMAYLTNQEIHNSEQFIVPFMTSTPANQNIIRVMQRDYGPIITPPPVLPETTDLDNVSPHKGNAPVDVELLRPGIDLPDRDRDYTCDSLVFAVSDSALISQRFTAEKRIVYNYGTYDINCVAEEKTGKLFDYTEQTWLDYDLDAPGATWRVKGGSVDVSNYEPNITELFTNIPQKEVDGKLIWKRLESSVEEFSADLVGFDVLSPTNNNYDSDNHTLWANDVTVAGRTIITTSRAEGKEDDEMDPALWFNYDSPGWEDITELEWMGNEGYIAVKSFTHKIAQAAYFYLPHPNKNFYVWFDTAQLSADPGDDGLLDPVFAVDADNNPDVSYNGGSIRVSIDSYDTAGIVAQRLVDRINSSKYDSGKKYVQVNTDNAGNPVYQAIVAGNINDYFVAEISDEDSSVVRITCLAHGIINTDVFDENDNISLPTTSSEDAFTISLVDDGDTDFYVDITNTIAGTVLPPVQDVTHPDADTSLNVSVSEEPYTPTQPGITKVVSAFLPYEDMQSLSRGYRQTNDDGIEQCLAGPVAYIQDDVGSLIYPVIMSNVSMKDPDQYDGVLEPLEIRSRASRNSPDAYFIAHDIKGILQSDVAEDSRRRSNPITQFIDNDRTYFEPYEDGVEHMESSPSVEGFTRTPLFDGAGINDLTILGDYVIAAGAGAETYFIRCAAAYPVSSSSTYDKFQWSKSDGVWSDSIELSNTSTSETEIVLTFSNLGSTTVSGYQFLEIPGGTTAVTLKAFGRGDINDPTEYYKIQFHDGSAWIDIDDGGIIQLNNDSHPAGEDATHEYTQTPHWTYSSTPTTPSPIIPFFTASTIKFRVWSSPAVTADIGLINAVKLSFLFARRAGRLDLDHGLYAVFDNNQGHNSGDVWQFEAIAKTHEDSVGCAPLPGYLTWQESKISPFVETTYKEHVTNNLKDLDDSSLYASGSLVFNYSGQVIDETYGSCSSGVTAHNTDQAACEGAAHTWTPSPNWEIEYLRTLNGQAFTLEDSSGSKKRFEFDNDGILENDGEELISILRPETYYIRFPDVDNTFQKRDTLGNKLWTDGTNSFAAYSTAPTPASDFAPYVDKDDIMFVDLTEEEWALYYEFVPDLVEPSDITTSVPSVEDYAGKHFVITDAIDESTDHVLNTVSGGRYAVWFNVVDPLELNADGDPTPIPGSTAPEFDAYIDSETILYYDEVTSGYKTAIELGYPGTSSESEWAIAEEIYVTRVVKPPRWSNDSGLTIQCARPKYDSDGDIPPDDFDKGTGWDPDPDTQTMSIDTLGQGLYTSDAGETIAAYTGLPHPADTSGDGISDFDEWIIAGGYEQANLNEFQWHAFEGWENYEKLNPQLIEVVVNNTDSIKRLMSKTLRAVRKFRNPNQSKVFICEYIKPPAYEDMWDLIDIDLPAGVPDDGWPAGEPVAGTWFTADYDSERLVKITPDWFNQYAYDPDSPPIEEALQNGWSRGHFTLKITSRNLGYHKVNRDVIPSIHEPGYSSVPTDVSDIRTFSMDQDENVDIGGHKTFKQLLQATTEKINNSSLDITATMLYDNITQHATDSAGNNLYQDPTSTLETGLIKTTVNTGMPYVKFSSSDVFLNTFILSPTLEERNTYFYHDKLCGIRLIQGSPGPTGNTDVTFHHYNEDVKGNVLGNNFSGGYSSGPHVNDVVSSMNMSTSELRPHDHISSAAGMIYNDMPSGTDSITFGGWKK